MKVTCKHDLHKSPQIDLKIQVSFFIYIKKRYSADGQKKHKDHKMQARSPESPSTNKNSMLYSNQNLIL